MTIRLTVLPIACARPRSRQAGQDNRTPAGLSLRRLPHPLPSASQRICCSGGRSDQKLQRRDASASKELEFSVDVLGILQIQMRIERAHPLLGQLERSGFHASRSSSTCRSMPRISASWWSVYTTYAIPQMNTNDIDARRAWFNECAREGQGEAEEAEGDEGAVSYFDIWDWYGRTRSSARRSRSTQTRWQQPQW